MKRLREFTNDEDNPFGVGTDLIISLLAIFLIVIAITLKSYQDTNSKYQQSITSIENYRNQVAELTELLTQKNATIRIIESEIKQRPRFPPQITITANQHDFPSGSAELTPDLEEFISNDLINQIENNVKEYDINTVVVIGHTDGQALSSKTSNIDNTLKKVSIDKLPIEKLNPGSNAELGLMRALAVVKKLHEIQKQGTLLQGLDPKRGYRVYSAAQLMLNNGEFAPPDPKPDAQRRRIEIYFTKSN